MLKALKGIIVTALFSAVFLHTPASAAQDQRLQSTSNRTPDVNIKMIRRIRCSGGHGTGVIIGRDTMITAAHVIEGQTGCRDDESGELLTVVYKNTDHDFAVLYFPTTRHDEWARISCGGFRTGRTYYSYGYAGVGDSDIMMTRQIATNDFVDGTPSRGSPFFHMRVLRGVVIPGMSGGPIFDEEGRVIGLNNLTGDNYRFGLSREIRDTYLCSRNRMRAARRGVRR